MRAAVFHPAARAEFEAAVARYEAERAGLGALFSSHVQKSVQRTVNAPLTRFPYSVVYLIESERIFILAVAHFRRRPNFWTERVKA